VAYHDRPAESIEQSFSSLTAVHGADAITSSTSEVPIIRDVVLDVKYLRQLGLEGQEPTWSELYLGQAK
jgi:hypothetical protein